MSSDALEQLIAAVEGAKGGSPLRHLTVVVPNFAAGRDVLRFLGRRVGVANTDVLTVGQVVERLSTRRLAPRTALPRPILEASIQRVLADSPGVFADVADQPATARALAAASWTLCAVASPSIVDPTPLVAEMLRIRRVATTDLSSRYYLRHEAESAVIEYLGDLGAVIVFLPDETVDKSELIAALQSRGQVIEPGAESEGLMVLHASDADDEIRSVARLVRRHLASGTPGHRIGVFYGASDPYLRATPSTSVKRELPLRVREATR